MAEPRCMLLLDTRVTAHRGEGPGSSFEWAVSAIASIGSHLARDGFGLRFTTESGSEVSGYSADAMAGTPFEGVLLDTLALVSMSNAHSLTAGLAGIRRGGGGGLVIAALGSLTDADLDALARFRHHASACVAIMLDTTSWAQATVPGQPAVRQRDHAQSCALLAGAGWRVVSVNARTDMRTMWGSAASNSQVLASR